MRADDATHLGNLHPLLNVTEEGHDAWLELGHEDAHALQQRPNEELGKVDRRSAAPLWADKEGHTVMLLD
jgi:hypothetical protein